MTKLLMIWVPLEDKTPEYVYSNIEHNKQFYDDLFLVDENNYDTLVEEALKDYRMYSFFQKRNGKNQFGQFKVWWLWKHPEYDYVDADVKILKPFETDKSKPAFGRYKKGIDNHIIKANGHGEFFNEWIHNMYHRHPGQCFPGILTMPQDWDNVVEHEYFHHMSKRYGNDT